MLAIHSSWTGPMSQYRYNEWYDKVEIGTYCLQWSLQADFGVMGGENFSSSTSHDLHQEPRL
eukprot:scaffold64965_cov79-Cyclotella_meneghiniana.AAC.1